MSLFIPTSSIRNSNLLQSAVRKGQLYNLDTDEYINFQFNPETFEVEQEFAWKGIQYLGSLHGGDLQYLSSGPQEFDIPFLYVNMPSAPAQEVHLNTVAFTGAEQKIFPMIRESIQRWSVPSDVRHRGSVIRLILGDLEIDAVITAINHKYISWFTDLSNKQALLTISFREWRLYAK